MDNETILKLAVIFTLGVILVVSVIMIGIVAIATDRDVARAEFLSFGGVILLGMLGGVSWWTARRHHWRLRVDRNGHEEGGE